MFLFGSAFFNVWSCQAVYWLGDPGPVQLPNLPGERIILIALSSSHLTVICYELNAFRGLAAFDVHAPGHEAGLLNFADFQGLVKDVRWQAVYSADSSLASTAASSRLSFRRIAQFISLSARHRGTH